MIVAGPWNEKTSPVAGGEPDSRLNTGKRPSGDCGGVNMLSSMPSPRSAREPSLPIPEDEDVDNGGEAGDDGCM